MKESKKMIRSIYRLSDIVISSVVTLAGIALMILVPTCFYLGLTLAVTGVVLFLCLRTGYRIEDHEGMYRRQQYVVPLECRDDFECYLKGDAATLNLQPFRMGGMLMEVYRHGDDNQVLCRFMEYEDEGFVPLSELIEADSSKLIPVMRYVTK